MSASRLHHAVPMEDLPTRTTSVEKSSVISISENKEWIAYITESKNLRITKLSILKNKYSLEPYTESNIGGYIEPDNILCYFLSVSSDGKRAALSFLKMDEYGEVEKKEKICNPDCLVFIKHNANNNFILERRIKFQGRAVFLKNDNLALINQDILEIYDCEKNYRRICWFNVRLLFVNRKWYTHEGIDTSEPVVNTSWVNFKGLNNSYEAAKRIVHISKLIQHNVLTVNYKYSVACVWSLSEDGARVMSFKCKESEEFMAFSRDYKFVATFIRKDKHIVVYNVKSGITISKMTCLFESASEELLKKVSQCTKYWMNYAYFCAEGRYLVVVTIDKLSVQIAGNNAMIIFEVWDISAAKSVYQQERGIKVIWSTESNNSTKFIQPFVVDTETSNNDVCKTFRVIYSTLSNTDGCEIKELLIDIHKERKAFEIQGGSIFFGNWKILEQSPFETTIVTTEKNNSDDTSNNILYFQQTLPDAAYILRIDLHTVQLWRQKAASEDKLIYIRAFKTSLYGFNNAYNEVWIRYTKDNIEDEALQYAAEETELSDLLTSTEFKKLSDTKKALVESVYESIYFMSNQSNGRIAVKIHQEEAKNYRLEEIYLPLNHLVTSNEYVHEYHFIESACQPLHYLLESEASKSNNKVNTYYQLEVCNLILLLGNRPSESARQDKRNHKHFNKKNAKYQVDILYDIIRE